MSGPVPAHPRDGDAAEYVLGTLTSAERQAFDRDVAVDPTLRAVVVGWQDRLAALAEALPNVEPGPELLDRIRRALDAPASAKVIALPVISEFERLHRSRSIWRRTAILAGSMAAALALVVASNALRAPSAEPTLVAVVNRAGDLPALIVRVDRAKSLVQVRSVSAETPADRSLELWSIAPGGSPRSLGVIGAGVTRASVSEPLAAGVTMAVTVEPRGGSPTGGPTGPVVYTGRLLAETD